MSGADGSGLWVYPLRRGDSLASHEWVEFHVHRFLDSRFVAHGLAAGARADMFTAVLLWMASCRQVPAGTLPDDDVQLARLAGFGADLDAWRAARPVALQNWRAVSIEDAEPGDGDRLGHPFIAEIVQRAMAQKVRRVRAKASADAAVRRTRTARKLEDMGYRPQAKNRALVEALSAWLSDRDLFITAENVLAGMEGLGVPRVVALRQSIDGDGRGEG